MLKAQIIQLKMAGIRIINFLGITSGYFLLILIDKHAKIHEGRLFYIYLSVNALLMIFTLHLSYLLIRRKVNAEEFRFRRLKELTTLDDGISDHNANAKNQIQGETYPMFHFYVVFGYTLGFWIITLLDWLLTDRIELTDGELSGLSCGIVLLLYSLMIHLCSNGHHHTS